jgi:hypothetical protein
MVSFIAFAESSFHYPLSPPKEKVKAKWNLLAASISSSTPGRSRSISYEKALREAAGSSKPEALLPPSRHEKRL